MPRAKSRKVKVQRASRASRVLAWVVYMLRCGDGSLYTGCTNDLPGRFQKHATGKGAKYTKRRLPVRLVYRERVDDRSAALKREYALKQLSRSEKLALLRRRKPTAKSSRPMR